MTQYKADYPFSLLFPPQSMDNVLAEWLAKKGIAQFHCAETEKYAHVTFFFNGGTENEFSLETRAIRTVQRSSGCFEEASIELLNIVNTNIRFSFIMV